MSAELGYLLYLSETSRARFHWDVRLVTAYIHEHYVVTTYFRTVVYLLSLYYVLLVHPNRARSCLLWRISVLSGFLSFATTGLHSIAHKNHDLAEAFATLFSNQWVARQAFPSDDYARIDDIVVYCPFVFSSIVKSIETYNLQEHFMARMNYRFQQITENIDICKDVSSAGNDFE